MLLTTRRPDRQAGSTRISLTVRTTTSPRRKIHHSPTYKCYARRAGAPRSVEVSPSLRHRHAALRSPVSLAPQTASFWFASRGVAWWFACLCIFVCRQDPWRSSIRRPSSAPSATSGSVVPSAATLTTLKYRRRQDIERRRRYEFAAVKPGLYVVTAEKTGLPSRSWTAFKSGCASACGFADARRPYQESGGHRHELIETDSSLANDHRRSDLR